MQWSSYNRKKSLADPIQGPKVHCWTNVYGRPITEKSVADPSCYDPGPIGLLLAQLSGRPITEKSVADPSCYDPGPIGLLLAQRSGRLITEKV
jgi:hypothetical protein